MTLTHAPHAFDARAWALSEEGRQDTQVWKECSEENRTRMQTLILQENNHAALGKALAAMGMIDPLPDPAWWTQAYREHRMMDLHLHTPHDPWLYQLYDQHVHHDTPAAELDHRAVQASDRSTWHSQDLRAIDRMHALPVSDRKDYLQAVMGMRQSWGTDKYHDLVGRLLDDHAPAWWNEQILGVFRPSQEDIQCTAYLQTYAVWHLANTPSYTLQDADHQWLYGVRHMHQNPTKHPWAIAYALSSTVIEFCQVVYNLPKSTLALVATDVGFAS